MRSFFSFVNFVFSEQFIAESDFIKEESEQRPNELGSNLKETVDKEEQDNLK